MFRRVLLILVLPLMVGVPLGVMALGLALQHDLPVLLLYLVAPGLYVGSHMVGQTNQFLGPEVFAGMKVAMYSNAIYYFLLLAAAGFYVDRAMARARGRRPAP